MLPQRYVIVCLLSVIVLSVKSSLTADGRHSDTQIVSTPFNPKSASSLVLLQLLFRHGDRSPTHLPPWDVHSYEWPQGAGQLTKLGMKQAYEYGIELRKRYNDFLPQQYNRSMVQVHSTDYDRTLMTVQCMLVGLFPTNDSLWSPWQPIPIHTQDALNDHLFGHSPCPKLSQLNSQYNSSERSVKFREKYKPLLEQLSNNTHTTVNESVAHRIADAMFCEAQHNMSQPPWMTEEMFEGLMNMRNETNSLHWMAPGAAQLAGGPLLAEMTRNMEQRAKKTSSKEKLFLFSAHDSTVGSLARAMGIFNNLQPPYLTTILVELHQQGQGFFVKTMFHNHTQHSPFTKTIQGCAEFCPLSEFRQLLNDHMVLPAHRQEACALTTASKLWKENGASILTGVVIVLVVTVLVMAYKLRKARLLRRDRGSIQYRKLLQENADNDEEDDRHDDI